MPAYPPRAIVPAAGESPGAIYCGSMATHEVLNQPPPFVEVDLFQADPALTEALGRGCAGAAAPTLSEIGRLAGSAEAAEWGRLANSHPPVLRTHDRFGHRVDEVEYHPAYHDLMEVAVSHGLHGLALDRAPDTGAHVARGRRFYLWTQVDAGHGCPISMTYCDRACAAGQPERRRGLGDRH